MRKILMVIAATVIVVVAGVLLFSGQEMDQKWLATYDSCAEVRQVAQTPTLTPPWPFGAISECRAVGSERHYVGNVEASVFYLVQTETGPVGLVVDYTGLDAGRQYQSRGREVAADEMPGLTGDEKRLLEDAIGRRDGVHPYVWMLHYGDG